MPKFVVLGYASQVLGIACPAEQARRPLGPACLGVNDYLHFLVLLQRHRLGQLQHPVFVGGFHVKCHGSSPAGEPLAPIHLLVLYCAGHLCDSRAFLRHDDNRRRWTAEDRRPWPTAHSGGC